MYIHSFHSVQIWELSQVFLTFWRTHRPSYGPPLTSKNRICNWICITLSDVTDTGWPRWSGGRSGGTGWRSAWSARGSPPPPSSGGRRSSLFLSSQKLTFLPSHRIGLNRILSCGSSPFQICLFAGELMKTFLREHFPLNIGIHPTLTLWHSDERNISNKWELWTIKFSLILFDIFFTFISKRKGYSFVTPCSIVRKSPLLVTRDHFM